MKTIALAAFFVAGLASAQVNVQIGFPTITFSSQPQLVVVEPGVQVVPDYGEEVFFVDGYYWHRRGPAWYRASNYQGGWVVVDRGIPGQLVRYKPGHYKHYRPAAARPVYVGPAPHRATVVINPPGPGKIKVKGNKHK